MRLWDLTTRQRVTPFPGHTAPVGFLAFSHDGRVLAAGCDDKTATVWDVLGRHKVMQIKTRNRPIFVPVDISPDGRVLAVGDAHAIRLWNLDTRREVGRLPAFRPGDWGQVNSLAFSPDGILLASGAAGSATMKLWDVARRQLLYTFTGYQNFSSCPAFSPDGRLLASYDGGRDAGVRVWDVSTKQLVQAFKLFSFQISWMGFSPDGKTLVTSSRDETVKLWNVASWQEATTLRDLQLSDWAGVFQPDGSALITGRLDGQVRFWQAAPIAAADREPASEGETPLHPTAAIQGGVVTLSWRPVPNAVAYDVYGSATATARDALAVGRPKRIRGTTFTDPAPAVGGETRHYRIEALLRQNPGRELPGPRAAVEVVPPSGPPGWIGASFDERGPSGSVSWQPESEVITLRGSGTDFWARADSGYFAGVPADGDRQMSVRALTRPRDTSGWAKAGLMLREGLAPGARNVALLLSAEGGLFLQWRAAPGGGCEGNPVLSDAALHRLPRGKLLLRLICRRDEVRAEYSQDGGLSFRPAGKPIRLSPPLQAPVYAGLAITSNNPDQMSEAKFTDWRTEPLRR